MTVDPKERWWYQGQVYVQQTHEEDGFAGILETPTGERIAFAGHGGKGPTSEPPEPFPPFLESVCILGDLTAPGHLEAGYVLRTEIGEDASTFRWVLDGVEVGTSRTYTTAPADGGKTISLEITPAITVLGKTGRMVPISADLQWTPPQPMPPGEPWRVPNEWPGAIPEARPRGPGIVRGPHPAGGPYLDVLPSGRIQGHVDRAAAWDPFSGIGQTSPDRAFDVAIAHATTGDAAFVEKANLFLGRAGTPAARGEWWWITASILADHLWESLDPMIRRGAQVAIGMELDSHRTGDKAGVGWGDLTWEGWPQKSGPRGYAWALIVWHERGDPDWDRLLQWFGEVYYLRYAPWKWRVTMEDLASWPQQTYWQANEAGGLYHLHLAMTVATGLDHFVVQENGGWYGAMQGFVRHRRLPNGTDIGINQQASWFYQPPYFRWSHGFPHAHALAFQTGDPIACWEAWEDKRLAIPGGDETRIDLLQILSPPWSAFIDPDAARMPVSGDYGVRRTQGLLVARQGWNEDDQVVWWQRGQSLGHHLVPAPGDFGIYHKGRLAGKAVTYGYASDVEVYHRSYGLHTNGMLFFSPDDRSDEESVALFHTPGQPKATYAYLKDGSCNMSQNPTGRRVSQGPPNLPNPWEDYKERAAEFALSKTLSYRDEAWGVAEVMDLSPGFRHFSSTVPLHKPLVNNKPDRVEEGGWIRAFIWLREEAALVIIDRTRPLPLVKQAWQIHSNAQPVMIAPGLHHIENHRLVESLEGGWPHVAPPRARIQGSRYQCDADLWLRQWVGGQVAPAPEIVGGPAEPFMVRTEAGWVRLTGINAWPYPAHPGHHPEAAPDELATWVYLLPPWEGPSEIVTVLSTGPEALPASLAANGVTVGARTVVFQSDQTVQVG